MVCRGGGEGAIAVVDVRRTEVLLARAAAFASRLAFLLPVHDMACSAQVCPRNQETTSGQYRHCLSVTVSPVVAEDPRGCS